MQRLELLQRHLCWILIGEVLHEEILEDHPILFHFASLLHEPGGDDIFKRVRTSKDLHTTNHWW